MSGADVLQCVTAVEMLGTGGEIDAFGPVAAVVEIVRIVVVEHWMKDVNVDPANPIDHAHQPLQPDPRVVMHGNLESLLHRRARQWTPAPRAPPADLPLTVPAPPHPH